jgi:hypothetical protein
MKTFTEFLSEESGAPKLSDNGWKGLLIWTKYKSTFRKSAAEQSDVDMESAKLEFTKLGIMKSGKMKDLNKMYKLAKNKFPNAEKDFT